MRLAASGQKGINCVNVSCQAKPKHKINMKHRSLLKQKPVRKRPAAALTMPEDDDELPDSAYGMGKSDTEPEHSMGHQVQSDDALPSPPQAHRLRKGQLAPSLPDGAQLGCSKCRRARTGCKEYREKAHVKLCEDSGRLCWAVAG